MDGVIKDPNLAPNHSFSPLPEIRATRPRCPRADFRRDHRSQDSGHRAQIRACGNVKEIPGDPQAAGDTPPGGIGAKDWLDSYGRRSGAFTAIINEWLHETVSTAKTFYSYRHFVTSVLRNTLGPDGRPAVDGDIQRHLLGHGKKDVHSGYGENWVKTLKAAIEIIPNPFSGGDDALAPTPHPALTGTSCC
jgi:hypothetical protein